MKNENIQIKEFNMDFTIGNEFFNKHENKLNKYYIFFLHSLFLTSKIIAILSFSEIVLEKCIF